MAVETRRVSLHDMVDRTEIASVHVATRDRQCFRRFAACEARDSSGSSSKWINAQDHMRWHREPVAGVTTDRGKA